MVVMFSVYSASDVHSGGLHRELIVESEGNDHDSQRSVIEGMEKARARGDSWG